MKADSSIYRLQHTVIKRMVLIVFGTHHFDKLLQYSKQEDLKGWIKVKKSFLQSIYRRRLKTCFRDRRKTLETLSSKNK